MSDKVLRNEDLVIKDVDVGKIRKLGVLFNELHGRNAYTLLDMEFGLPFLQFQQCGHLLGFASLTPDQEGGLQFTIHKKADFMITDELLADVASIFKRRQLPLFQDGRNLAEVIDRVLSWLNHDLNTSI